MQPVPSTAFESKAGGAKRIKYVRKPADACNIRVEALAKLDAVADRYVFRANDDYLGLIDRPDPNDPIRHLVVSSEEGLDDRD